MEWIAGSSPAMTKKGAAIELLRSFAHEHPFGAASPRDG